MRLYLSKLMETEGSAPGIICFSPTVSKYCPARKNLDLRKDRSRINGYMLVYCNPITDAQHAAAKADADITYIPIEGPNGKELSPFNLIGDIDPAKRAILKTRFDSIGIPIDGLTLSDPIRKLFMRIQKRAQIRQRLLNNDISDVLDDVIPEVDRIKISSLISKPLPELSGATVRDVLLKAFDLNWPREFN